MNQKQTNKRLTEFKSQYSDLIKVMAHIEDECVSLLGYSTDNNYALHWTVDYLHGIIPQKELRPNIEADMATDL